MSDVDVLAERILDLLADAPGLTDKKMFGGRGFMLHGNMACGVHTDGRMMVRCEKEATAGHAGAAGVDTMKRGTTVMRGWLLIDPDVVVDDAALAHWVGVGRAYAESLPPK